MKITLERTDETFEAPLKGGIKVPTRVWRGTTDKGTEIEAYVLSLVPADPENLTNAERLQKECREAGMVPARQVYDIDLGEKTN